MGSEIFKDSLRKLEAKPKQKFQKNISLETRENSQHNDIKILMNKINSITKILSQRNSGNKIYNKEYISELLLTKITLEKNLVALLVNRHGNMDSKTNNNNKNTNNNNKNTKNITPKLIMPQTNNRKDTIIKDKSNRIYASNIYLKRKDKDNIFYLGHSKSIKNTENTILKLNYKVHKIKINISKYRIIIYTNKFYIIFDPGIKIKDPGFDNKTMKINIILDNFKFYNWVNTKILNIMNNILYERRMNIFIDEDNYPIFIDICKLLEDNCDDDLMTIKSQWSFFLIVLECVSGIKIHFNDKFGRLNIKFENEIINLRIPKEINTHSAYLEVNIKKNDDYLYDRTQTYNIINNENARNNSKN